MKAFTMCPQCQAEYDEPYSRRFHAQPNACPVCGPRLELWRSGPAKREQNAADFSEAQNQPRSAERSYDALLAAANAIREGKIVAVKGLGGFHLMADARNDKAVQLLRERKQREEKPFALMFPSLESVKANVKSHRWKSDCCARPKRRLSSFGKSEIRNPKSEIPVLPATLTSASCCLTRHCTICCWTNSVFPSSPPAAI